MFLDYFRRMFDFGQRFDNSGELIKQPKWEGRVRCRVQNNTPKVQRKSYRKAKRKAQRQARKINR